MTDSRRVRFDAEALRLRFRWPDDEPQKADNFFLGVWHPWRSIQVEWTGVGLPESVVRQGRNWFLASASSPLHATGTGLVHAAPERSLAVAFRGYIVPHLQSYSPSEEVLDYWDRHLLSVHNGVFSAAVVGPEGRTLTLMTDACGIGTLYYASLGEATVFSTNPRYLVTADGCPDLLAWRCLIQTSWIVGDQSLTDGVRRVPAGHALCVGGGGRRMVRWFDFDRLPGGTQPVGPTAVADVEEAFQEAMRRLLRFQAGAVVLPLSSGFDSRRILSGMIKWRADFRAITCRVFQKGHRDLDARFASEMARDFGFPHTVVEAETAARYIGDDRLRRVLVDAETREHTWAVRVMEALPGQPSLFFDGIGGDVLGDPVGWRVHVGLGVGVRSPGDDIAEITARSISDAFDPVLRPGEWPCARQVREGVAEYLRQFVPRANLAELAFLLLRQRRTIALWSQQLLPPGHVVVCPYFDLDYLRLLLGFSSSDKHATKFQRACLREFWPDLYRYQGNRDVPEELPAEAAGLEEERALACYAAMYDEVRCTSGLALLRRLLTRRARLRLDVSTWSGTALKRSLWYLLPLMELIWREVKGRRCWEVSAN